MKTLLDNLLLMGIMVAFLLFMGAVVGSADYFIQDGVKSEIVVIR